MHRYCTLLFPGGPKRTHKVNTGIPRGSPLSPLLFVVYVAGLHLDLPTETGFMLSYVDDFKITVASNTYEKNLRLLNRAWRQVDALARNIGMAFSIEKTELIHWRTQKQRDQNFSGSLTINGVVISPEREKLRWLGYWWTPNLNPAKHF